MTALAVLTATIILIGLYTLGDILFTKQLFLVKNICFGVFGFFGVFVIISGALFALGIYSLWTAYGICFVLIAAAIFILWIRGGYKLSDLNAFEKAKDLPKHFMPCITGLLILSVIVSFSKFDYYGMGMDHGVYTTDAMYRVAGNNDLQIDLRGYHILDDINDKALYTGIINGIRAIDSEYKDYGQLLGYYNGLHTANEEHVKLSAVSGYLHGIPTYPALLSISGLIFGFSGMAHIQTLFLAVSVCLLFIILSRNLKLKLSVSLAFTVLFAISPIIIWTTKITLTECLLTLIMTAFLYLITSNDKSAVRLMWFPIAVFSFLHASVFTMMPVFILIFIILYVQRRDADIITSGLISLALYIAGFFMMLNTAYAYAINQYINPIRDTFSTLDFSYDGMIILVVVSAITAAIVLLLTRFTMLRINFKINGKVLLFVIKSIIIICLFYIAYKHCDKFVYHFFLNTGRSLSDLIEVIMGAVSESSKLTIVSYTLLSGFIILPVVLFGLFFKKDIFSKEKTILMTIIFVYCIIFYSAFMRRKVEGEYFLMRYIAPYIPVIFIMGAVYLDSLKIKAAMIISCISILALLPFSVFTIRHKDQSNADWDSVNRIISTVDELDENDIVLLTRRTMSYYFMPLDFLTDSVILPAADFKFVSDAIENKTGKVYILSHDSKFEDVCLVEFKVSFSEYPIIPGIMPPLPITADAYTYRVRFSEITDLSDLTFPMAR